MSEVVVAIWMLQTHQILHLCDVLVWILLHLKYLPRLCAKSIVDLCVFETKIA